jgi:D-glycero-D-manno-heptose 1,7-bisphosphate phosphatase
LVRAVFLDRDGVINQKPTAGLYVTKWEDFHILPGVIEAITLLNQSGFLVIVVTNQRCVAKGLMTVAELDLMHERMTDTLARAGAMIDETLYCPHEKEPPCDCRKPAPGMLLRAARARGIDLSASWMIGDSDNDMEAGTNAGCQTAQLIAAGSILNEPVPRSTALGHTDIMAPSLLDAILEILRREEVAINSHSTTPPAHHGSAARTSVVHVKKRKRSE